jgi:hypothetical protein
LPLKHKVISAETTRDVNVVRMVSTLKVKVIQNAPTMKIARI